MPTNPRAKACNSLLKNKLHKSRSNRIHNMGISRQLLVDNDDYVGCMDPQENSHITKWQLQNFNFSTRAPWRKFFQRHLAISVDVVVLQGVLSTLEFPAGKAPFSSRYIYKWWVFKRSIWSYIYIIGRTNCRKSHPLGNGKAHFESKCWRRSLIKLSHHISWIYPDLGNKVLTKRLLTTMLPCYY